MNKGRVLLAMSGGLDSSVAAMLLIRDGYEVVGCTFDNHCVPSIDSAKQLAKQLGIEHHVVDLSQEFRRSVMEPFVAAYKSGLTPNPCVWCNAYIKWGQLLSLLPQYDCDLLATGHYARILQADGQCFLRRAKDVHKDQTYFLWMLQQDALQRTIFPLGDYLKQEVREMAKQQGYVELSQKAESQEICFIPDNNYRTFLQHEGVIIKTGNFVDSDGKILGTHQGYSCYTVGQRKGLGIALGKPAFVKHIDAISNRVTLTTHDDLYTRQVWIRNGYFRVNPHSLLTAQIRYRSLPTNVVVEPCNLPNYSNCFQLNFEDPVWAVAPGQSVAIYENEKLVGGGFICDLSHS